MLHRGIQPSQNETDGNPTGTGAKEPHCHVGISRQELDPQEGGQIKTLTFDKDLAHTR